MEESNRMKSTLNSEEVIFYKDVLKIDKLYRKASIYRGCVFVSYLELKILEKLIQNNGCVLKTDLLEWLETTSCMSISAGYLNTIIWRLRKKFLCATGAKVIRTHYGVGYWLTI